MLKIFSFLSILGITTSALACDNACNIRAKCLEVTSIVIGVPYELQADYQWCDRFGVALSSKGVSFQSKPESSNDYDTISKIVFTHLITTPRKWDQSWAEVTITALVDAHYGDFK